MSWEYTYNDKLLCEDVIFRIPFVDQSANWAGAKLSGGGMTTYNTISGGTGEIVYTRPWGVGRYFDNGRVDGYRDQTGYLRVGFQFPPKIVSDSIKGSWEEPQEQQSSMPIAGFKYTGPRTISMNWTYIVDCFDEDLNNTAWTVNRISHYVRSVRGYFLQTKRVNDNHHPLVCYLKFWAIGGANQMSGRLASVDVKYGDTMVVPNNKPDYAFPLRTDISADIRLWGTGRLESSDQPLTNIDGLMDASPDWY